MRPFALDRWHDFIKSHDEKALWDLLHPDAVFESPVDHTPQRGREITFTPFNAPSDGIIRVAILASGTGTMPNIAVTGGTMTNHGIAPGAPFRASTLPGPNTTLGMPPRARTEASQK